MTFYKRALTETQKNNQIYSICKIFWASLFLCLRLQVPQILPPSTNLPINYTFSQIFIRLAQDVLDLELPIIAQVQYIDN